MKKVISAIGIALSLFSCDPNNTSDQTTDPALHGEKTLMAIFAHSDDESTVNPILSKYARQGVNVQLVIVTDGSKGVSAHANIPAGDSLAIIRADEALCVTKTLGINPPILLNFADDELPLRENIYALDEAIDCLFAHYKPDVVITWGPDGGYGHPDHRIVSDIVTEVIQARDSLPGLLLYVGWPTNVSGSEPEIKSNVVDYIHENLHRTKRKYLNYHISYGEEDSILARKALDCYTSQFTTQDMNDLCSVLYPPERQIYFRSFHGSSEIRNKIFE